MLRESGGEFLAHCGVTQNAWERMCGLLPRSQLGSDEGLWIQPCNSVHTFFMRFPIDIAFLDGKGKVLAIYPNLPPWRHTWIHLRARVVLEARAGTFADKSLRMGDVLCLSS